MAAKEYDKIESTLATVEVYQTSAKEIMERLTLAVVMFGVNLTSSLTLKSL